MRKVLVVGADPAIEQALRLGCVRRRAQAVSRADEQEAAGVAEVALCIAILRGSGDQNLQRIRALSKLFRDAPIVVLARGLGDELAFELSRFAVTDLIALGGSAEEIAERALSHLAETGRDGQSGQAALVGDSPAMRELRRGLRDAARYDSKVLLEGETGTGKGVAARMIHELSGRRARPFVHVDCAALSPTLIESELFGHEKGAFTGAASARRGRFELAAEGTVFLDEIGDLDPALQTKLLRALEDLVFERVGGSQSFPMTARVIAATSRDLGEQMAAGRFREDLYYRLNVLRFQLPPLRERLEDLPMLVEHGLRRLSATLACRQPLVSPALLGTLADHAWPGNVRELVNLLERLLVSRHAEVLDLEDLDAVWRPEAARRTRAEPRAADPGGAPVDDEGERGLIREALLETGGNVSRAARRLGMRRGTLRYKIKRYGLSSLIPRD
jgi:DNA-binding NtrC family response regulator